MSDADALTGIFDFLVDTGAPMSFDDLLRSKWVYGVSAFDKLLHDLVRTGMVETFQGKRPVTPKYAGEPFPLSLLTGLTAQAAGAAPPETIFEEAIRAKHKTLSFQDPAKVADALGFIWAEDHKWARIAGEIGKDEKVVRTTLKLSVDRRNAIVHEADLDPLSNMKQMISRQDVEDTHQFLLNVGRAICKLAG